MSYMLGGILSGAGAGLSEVGKTLEDRRKLALAQASDEAQNRERLAAAAAEGEATRQSRSDLAEYNARAAADRNRETNDTRREIAKEQIVGRERIAERTIGSREELARLERDHETNLVQMRGRITAQLQAASDARDGATRERLLRLQTVLDGPDVVGQQFGAPRLHEGNYISEVIVTRRNGTTERTGQWVSTPRNRRPDLMDDDLGDDED